MAIDKSLYAAPQGLDDLAAMDQASPPIEIEIEDPEAVTIGMDGMEIEITPDAESEGEFNDNLAEYVDEETLQSIAEDLISDYDEDVASRKDWMQTYVDGLELLGMKIEERTEPWEGACGVFHPMLSEALVKFQSETMMATFPAAGPVKTQIIGKETPAKKESAQRVADDMNYQLTDVMKEYRPEHERSCGAWAWLVMRSRRCTLTRVWIVKCLSLYPLKISLCLTARVTWSPRHV